MFDKFYDFYNLKKSQDIIINKEVFLDEFNENIIGFKELMSKFQGTIFGQGEYRLHCLKDIKKWNSIVSDAFPEMKNKIECFASDWLGRQFAIYKVVGEKEKILMFEPGTGFILEMPGDFVTFHNETLLNNYDACVAYNFYQQWLKTNDISLNLSQCVGYKIPLFIGGEDNFKNLELIEMEVYWYISAQLIIKI